MVYFICRDALTEISVRQPSFTFAVYESDRLLLNISGLTMMMMMMKPSVSWILIRSASFLSSPVYNSVLLAVSPPTAAASSSHLFLNLYTAERRLLPNASSVSCRQPWPVSSITPPCCKPSPPPTHHHHHTLSRHICAEL